MLHQVLNYVNGYLNSHCTLRDLQTWLLSNLQQILDSGGEAAIEMADQIDADLVEFGEGLIDETAVRERIESYVRLRETIPFSFSEIECPVTTHIAAATETIKNHLEVAGPVEDLRLDHVFT